MTCSSVNLRQFQLLNRQSCNPRITLLFQQNSTRLRRVQTRNNTKIYARTLPSRLSKSASKEKPKEKDQEKQIVAQEEESHTVTLAGKIATPITEFSDGGSGFWFTVGDTEISNKPGGGIAFLVQVQASGDVIKNMVHDIEVGDVVIVLGQMQPSQEFMAQQIEKKSGLPEFLEQLPTMKQLYRSALMPFRATDESVGEGKENIFNHMLEHQEEWWDMQFQVAPGSRQPHLKHRTLRKKAIWLDDSIPTGMYEQFLKAGRPLLYPGWPLLFEHPDEFWDYESYKLSSSSPTFIHKATGCGTWFDEHTATEDQIAFVNEIRSESYNGLRPEDPWQNLMEKQSEWMDIRDNKRNPRAPDFRHKQFRNGLALWQDSAPEHIQEFLQTETNLTFAKPTARQDKSEWWKDLFENQSAWMDNRAKKAAGDAFGNYPDFKSLDTTKALWLDSNDTPSWVNDKIEQLEGLIAA